MAAKEQTEQTALPGESIAPRPKRLAALASGMGAKLETVADVEVTVVALSFETRPVRNLNTQELEDKDIGFITLDDGEMYYTFSAPLIEKLHGIDAADLPALAVFHKKDLPSGHSVWTIE
jgi:hypothetical protein